MTNRKKPDALNAWIQRAWGKLPVVDAKHDLPVYTLPIDLENAVRGNGECCVFAQACRRSFGSNKAMFLRTVAYLDLPDEQGNRKVYRFKISMGTRKQIESFDRGHPVLPTGGFILHRPGPSDALDRKLRNSRAQYAKLRAKRAAGLVPKIRRSQVPLSWGHPITIDLVRNGTGRMHLGRPTKGKRS